MTRARDVANRAIVANTVGATELNLTDNYAFTGTVSGAGGGKVLKVQHYESTTAISSSAAVPHDNTTPTSTEGVQIMTASFTATSSSSDLYFFITVYGNEDSNVGDRITYPLFDGTTFIGMGYQDATNHGNGTNWNQTSIILKYSPASTSAKTYTLRGSVNGGSTFESLNTVTYMDNAKYGGNIKNTITIMEIG